MERHEAFLSQHKTITGKDAVEWKSFMACISKVTVTDSTLPFHQNYVHVPGEYGICDTAVIIIRFGGCHGELLSNFNYLDFDPNMQQFIQRHTDAWHSFCLDRPPVPFHPPSIFTFSARRTTVFCRCPRVLFRKGTSSVKVKTTKYSIDRKNLLYLWETVCIKRLICPVLPILILNSWLGKNKKQTTTVKSLCSHIL